MIHIAIGTKAQLIKMAPVIWQLQHRGLKFNLIDLGQHALLTQQLREEFNLPEPQVCLGNNKNISTLPQAGKWLLRIFLKSLSGAWIKKKIFLSEKGICLIHGDTVSTLLGLYLAKRAGIKVAHVEAGLRSFHWHEPFPEEIIRRIAMKYSDVLFAPSPWAYENLISMGLKKKAVRVPCNTGFESARFSMHTQIDTGLEAHDFCLVSFHRVENIFSKQRLQFIIALIESVAASMPVVFIQHEPTLQQLRKRGYLRRVHAMEKVQFLSILSHAHFIRLLEQCKLVITDGGSIQEESFYLGKPCLLLRHYTERNEGVGDNVVVSGFDQDTINYFLAHHQERVRQGRLSSAVCASAAIVEHLKTYA